MEYVLYFIATLALSYVISSAMTPAMKVPDPASMNDFDFPQADEGTPQAVIFGDCWSTSWTVLATGNFRTSAIKKSAGGKK